MALHCFLLCNDNITANELHNVLRKIYEWADKWKIRKLNKSSYPKFVLKMHKFCKRRKLKISKKIWESI